MKGRVLIIAGSDPSGGAGVQADIKTVTALGGYAATAITALTVQNTRYVAAVHPVLPRVIHEQIAAVLEDIGADAIKIGMIAEEAAAKTISEALREQAAGVPMVLDPVLIATSGDALAGAGVAETILRDLLPLSSLVTPNVDEMEALTGLEIEDADDLIIAAQALRDRGARAVLAKGAHLSGDEIVDALVTAAGVETFRNARIETTSTHGTGCTLASAIAAGLAQGMKLQDAVARAIRYVREAIRTAPGFGSGAGPLNHAHLAKA